MRTSPVLASLLVVVACGGDGGGHPSSADSGAGDGDGGRPDANGAAVCAPPTRDTAIAGGDVHGLWGSPSRVAWAVAGSSWPENDILYFDGSAWGEVVAPSGFYSAVTGTGPCDVFIARNDQVVLHWDGTEFTPTEAFDPDSTGASGGVDVLFAVGPDDVWAALSNDDPSYGWFSHWDGSSWTPHRGQGLTFIATDTIWGTTGADLWAPGCELSGSSCRLVDHHWDGNTWRIVGVADPPCGGNLLAWVYGDGPAAGWGECATTETLWNWDGSRWASVPNPFVGQVWRKVYGPLDSAYGVSHEMGIVTHYDGASWTKIFDAGQARGPFMIATAGGDDVWAAGDQLLRCSATACEVQPGW